MLSVDGVLREYDPIQVMACDVQVADVVTEPPICNHWMVTAKRREGRLVWVADKRGREHLYNERHLVDVLRPRGGG